MLSRLVVVTAAFVVGLYALVAPAVSSIDTLLRTNFHFTSAQILEVQRGRAISVSLPGSIDRELVAAGAVRIDAPAERLLEVLRDIQRFEQGTGFLATVRISEPPTLTDFGGLLLPPGDVSDLRRCVPGNCKVKLGRRAFAQLAAIDWRAGDAEAQAQQFVRRMAFEALERYRQGGAAAVGEQIDEDPARQVAAEFGEMTRATEWLKVTVPGLADYLARYPKAPKPPGMEEYFYWSIIEFNGLKKTLRLNHIVLYPLAGAGGARWAMANRQIYASHYFQNALEVRLMVDDPEKVGRAHYLLVLNVARPDGLTGIFGPIVRYKVRSGSREALRKTLVGTKLRCETPYPTR